MKVSEVDMAGTESLILKFGGGAFRKKAFSSMSSISILVQTLVPFSMTWSCILFQIKSHFYTMLGKINIDALKFERSLNYLNIVTCSKSSNVIAISTKINFCFHHINIKFHKVFFSEIIITKKTLTICQHLLVSVSILTFKHGDANSWNICKILQHFKTALRKWRKKS